VKFTLRDLFWLTAVVGLSVGWWLDHRWEDHGGTTMPIRGVVVATNSSDLVEISLGSDDGLKRGTVMQVHRGNTYLGKITIRVTSPDRAVGQRERLRYKIQKGDMVTGGVIVGQGFFCGSP